MTKAYVFGPGIGQAAAGTSWSYGIDEASKPRLYSALAEGQPLVEAWFDTQMFLEDGNGCYVRYGTAVDPETHLFGHNFIGNPFVFAHSIPEPATLVVACLGLVLLLRKRRRAL